MFRLFRYLKKSWVAAVAAPLFMLLEVTMDLLQPTLMSDVVDVGVANGDLHYVWMMLGRMLGAAVIGLIGGAGCTVFSSIAGVSFGTELRQDLFNAIQRFSFAELDTLQPASLITRLTNDVMQMQNLVMMMLRIMVRAPLLTIGGVVMALMLNAKLGLILVVAMPLLASSIIFIIRRGFPLFRSMQQKIDRVNDVTRENLIGVRVVKAYVRQEKEKERFAGANDDLTGASVKAFQTMMLLWPVLMVVMNASVVAALWFGGRQAIAGSMEAGKIMAFIQYLIQILSSLMMVAMILMGASRAKASADRINEVLETEPSIADPDGVQEPTGWDVEFRDVSFRYPGAEGEPALKHVSFHAGQGKTVGILGATGSGKTTLVNLIPRLYDVTEGQVLVGGIDVRRQGLESLRRRIGVVLQKSVLFSGTVAGNLRWGRPEATQDELEAVAADAQAADFIAGKEEGYSSTIEQGGVNYSGGQKQRLSIARALIRNPQILILDDATSAVDMATEAKLQQALRRRVGTSTVFIIAQRISSVIDADKILVMDDGAIVAEGTHNELLKVSDIYRDIVRSQLGEEAVGNV